MTIENTGVALARQAAESLRALGEHGPMLAPQGSDRFGWSADVLDELARVAGLLVDAVGSGAGEPSADVARRAEALATAIVAHRNSLLRHGRGTDAAPEPPPVGTGGDRTDGPATATTGSRDALLTS